MLYSSSAQSNKQITSLTCAVFFISTIHHTNNQSNICCILHQEEEMSSIVEEPKDQPEFQKVFSKIRAKNTSVVKWAIAMAANPALSLSSSLPPSHCYVVTSRSILFVPDVVVLCTSTGIWSTIVAIRCCLWWYFV